MRCDSGRGSRLARYRRNRISAPLHFAEVHGRNRYALDAYGKPTYDEGELLCDGAGEHNLLQEPQDCAHHALPYFRRDLDAVAELQEPVSFVIGLGSAVSLLDLSTFWRDQ